MSRPRSEVSSRASGAPHPAEGEGSGTLGYRPDDHADAQDAPAGGGPVNPRLGPVGWARFVWRQLTSMRTALALLLLLGLAAVPGSLVPQNSADPNGVVQFQLQNPQWYKILNALQVFDTYTSFWFSAIYLLLFLSLVGCIIPRTLHHARALRAKPPVTPARLGRLTGHRTETSAADAERAIAVGREVLRKAGYRVVRYDQPDAAGGGRFTLSAERGYLRETGNLVFHTALVGLLVSVGVGSGFIYTGQKIVIQGQTFTNSTIAYDSFSPGRFFTDSQLDPYSIRLDSFDSKYSIDLSGEIHPEDYTAHVSTRTRGGEWKTAQIKVNEPLVIGGTQVYLLGNGYAPIVTVRDATGAVVGKFTTPFLSQDAALTSLGVIKVPDGLKRQLGLRGFFYPQPIQTKAGMASVYPEAGKNTILSLEVWAGSLHLNDGVPVNVYSLDTTGMTKLAGRDAKAAALEMTPGKTAKLPDGLGSVTFDGWKRYVSIEVHHDPTLYPVGTFAVLAVLGLLTSLFVPRRRAWIAATPGASGCSLEYAGLARGDDPRLEDAVASIAWQHLDRLGERPDWVVGELSRRSTW